MSFTSSNPGAVDSVGIDPVTGDMSDALSADLFEPGVSVSNAGGGPLLLDVEGEQEDLTRSAASYAADGGQGLLMFHFHNKVGDKAQVVELGTTPTVTLAAQPETVVLGSPTSLHVTVADPDDATLKPTGSVSIVDTDTSTEVATGTLTAGEATIAYTPTTVGAHHLKAVYAGEGIYSGAESPVTTVTVTTSATSVALTATPTKVVRGGSSTLKVTVANTSNPATKPTGSVTVVNTATHATVATGTLVNGVATIAYKPKVPGVLHLQASYAGNASTSGGVSPAVTLTVTKAKPVLTLTLGKKQGKLGKKVKATVKIATVLGIAPTGKVVFKANGKVVGTVTLTGGKAVLTFKPKARGKVKIVASYAGNATYSAGTSKKVTYTVT